MWDQGQPDIQVQLANRIILSPFEAEGSPSGWIRSHGEKESDGIKRNGSQDRSVMWMLFAD